MTAVKHEEYRRLTREELDALAGEPLPERAAMSLINANVAAPINLALALNVASDHSIAYANAVQMSRSNRQAKGRFCHKRPPTVPSACCSRA